jgi:AcrR family transcriptional regulator
VTTSANETRADGRRTRHEHRRPQLLEALTEYVLDNGLADFSLRNAAKAVGVTHATLVRHFVCKDELILETVTKVRADLLARLRGDIESDPELGVQHYLQTTWNRLCEPQERRQFLVLFGLVAQSAGGRGPSDLSDSLIGEFTQPITAMLRAEGRSPDEADDLAAIIVAQFRGLQLDLAVTGDRDRTDRAMRRFLALVVGVEGHRPG